MRRGFTLVELLVVIAIIALLVALLLPAVQSAREASRRIQCKNNLKNLALALLNFESANEVFPAAVQFDPGDRPQTSDNFKPNWVIEILPFFEQQPLYDAFDFGQYVSKGRANRIARGTTISSMLCPSDSGADIPFAGTTEGEGDNWARGNYAANGVNGVLRQNMDMAWGDPTRRGVMSLNKAVKLKQIADGTTKTVLVAEIRIGLTDQDRRGVWAMGTAGASTMFWHGYGGDCNGPNPANNNSDDVEGCLAVRKAVTMEVMQQQKMTCLGPFSQQASARSQHDPGGVQVAMADGSVRYLEDTINTTGPYGGCCGIWDRLIASADGSVFPMPE